jgi:hypothetical protein
VNESSLRHILTKMRQPFGVFRARWNVPGCLVNADSSIRPARISGTSVAFTAATYSSSDAAVAAGESATAALAAASPASAPERSAKLMPSRVHGSSSPAASPATSTRSRRSGDPSVRHRVRCPESRTAS